MDLKSRKARDAAFAEALQELNPEYVLRRELVAARRRAGLTQQQLARRMGTTQSVIARMEKGGPPPNFRTLWRLAQALESRLVVRFEQGMKGVGDTLR